LELRYNPIVIKTIKPAISLIKKQATTAVQAFIIDVNKTDVPNGNKYLFY
jgi:hypothetical protein